MKIKTSELTGRALDWAVTKSLYGEDTDYVLANSKQHNAYSTDWSQGGPIIEREKISIVTDYQNANVWIGSVFEPDWKFNRTGPTPLIAAMRCYVASRLGDELEVPDEVA